MERSPLAIHFVWIEQLLPYYARLAIESALVAVPDAEVHLHHVGRAAAGPHAEVLAGYPRVSVHAAPLHDYFAGCPGGPGPYLDVLARVPNGSPAAISNLVRLAVLWQLGGVYLDTDVLVLRGLHDPAEHGSYVGREAVWAANRRRVERGLGLTGAVRAAPWALTWLARRTDSRLLAGRARLADRLRDRDVRLQINNAVLAAPARAAFVAAGLERALHVDPAIRFALGPSLLDDVVAADPSIARVVPSSRFYAVPPGQSYRLFEDAGLRLPPDAQIVHYVASNHRRLLAGLQPDDARFREHSAIFWQVADTVRQAVAEGRAATPLSAAELVALRSAG